MHVKILIECSFTSEELLRIICKCCEITCEQVRISELKYKFNEINEIAHEQIKISKFICKFDRIDEVAHKQVRVSEFIYKFDIIDKVACEQVKVSKLSVNLMRLTELLMSE